MCSSDAVDEVGNQRMIEDAIFKSWILKTQNNLKYNIVINGIEINQNISESLGWVPVNPHSSRIATISNEMIAR